MSAHCCEHDTPAPQTVIDLPRYRRVLWVALVVNAAMFAIEIIGGIHHRGEPGQTGVAGQVHQLDGGGDFVVTRVGGHGISF